MNDCELLDMAAKAMGIEYRRTIDGEVIRYIGGGLQLAIGGARWNPLDDDGDALRLAVGLKFDINQDGNIVDVRGAYNGRDLFATETAFKDPCAATRRAIVRAGAEIGSLMP